MENATKALLIAASVLIVIVIIAFGMKTLGSTQGAANEWDKVSEAMGQSVFNSQFTDFEGVQSGVQVKVLLNKVAATHRNDSLHVVNVSGQTDIATYRASIKTDESYFVVVDDSDKDGFVDTISITQ